LETGTFVHFEQESSVLTAVEVKQPRRAPLISKLHGVFFALGIVVSSYQVRALGDGIVERLVIETRDGESVSGELGEKARAAVLPIAFARS
jgi:UTP:GlnB (protein PII) uridylyltransferase